MGRDFQGVLRFGGQQDHVKLVSLSVVLNCGNVDSVCPHLSSDAGHSQARSAQCLLSVFAFWSPQEPRDEALLASPQALTTRSISTQAPSGSAAAAIVVRAG